MSSDSDYSSFQANLDHRMPCFGQATSYSLSSALTCVSPHANKYTHSLSPHPSPPAPHLLPSPMLKQLCPVCESSTGSVRVIDDAVSTGNMF